MMTQGEELFSSLSVSHEVGYAQRQRQSVEFLLQLLLQWPKQPAGQQHIWP